MGRITSVQSHCHKHAHFKILLTYIPLVQSIHKTNPYTNIKLGHGDIIDRSYLFNWSIQNQRKYFFKGMERKSTTTTTTTKHHDIINRTHNWYGGKYSMHHGKYQAAHTTRFSFSGGTIYCQIILYIISFLKFVQCLSNTNSWSIQKIQNYTQAQTKAARGVGRKTRQERGIKWQP